MNLENVYSYHEPVSDQIDRYKDIRALGKNFAEYLTTQCPDSRERSIALTKIEEAVMWANASIARNG